MPKIDNTPWKEAIIAVLKANGKAMHYADIASDIQKRGLRTKVGATPAATVYTTIYESIKKEVENSPFVKVGVGEFFLKGTLAPPESQLPSKQTAAAEEAAETGGIIKAFGMFWRRDWVEWTAKPSLKGQQQEGSDPVDFANQHGVYLLHDGREVIYVGRTTEKRLAGRLMEHTRDRLNGRWDRFSWFGLLEVTEQGSLAADISGGKPHTREDIIITLEALLIEGAAPGGASASSLSQPRQHNLRARRRPPRKRSRVRPSRSSEPSNLTGRLRSLHPPAERPAATESRSLIPDTFAVQDRNAFGHGPDDSLLPSRTERASFFRG